MIYDIWYKAFMGTKPLCIWFDMDGRIMDLLEFNVRTRYLVSFGPEIYDAGLEILWLKKVLLNIVLIITLQESELIHVILYL